MSFLIQKWASSIGIIVQELVKPLRIAHSNEHYLRDTKAHDMGYMQVLIKIQKVIDMGISAPAEVFLSRP